MQPADLAIALRARSPWEATDLGLAMLQRWWRPVYAAQALVLFPIAFVLVTLGWAFNAVWVAMLLFWWLEPLYDRVVLHVLSRAVFGELPRPLAVAAAWRSWSTGLVAALGPERIDMARSFNLAVRQLEGQRGRAARERRRVLGLRARGHAVWLTVVWLHFEAALVWSSGALSALLLPAQLERAPGAHDSVLGALFEVMQMASVSDALIYAAVIFLLEPFYVAAGFSLYLNRRTVLEGWDIEVALRRIARPHAVVAALVLAVLLVSAFPQPAMAQTKSAKVEVAEVLKAPEFGHYRETTRWELRDSSRSKEREAADITFWHAIGYSLAKAAQVFLWGAAAAALAYALWWLAKRVPQRASASALAYRAPPALFGMELAPEKLPADVPEAAAALAREGKLREALSVLYRGALSELVHKRGVQLLASHTEAEAVRLARMPYFGLLVDAWRRCAYANRLPPVTEVEELVKAYRAAFS